MPVLHTMKKRSKRLKKTCSATNNNNLFTRETAFPSVIHRPQLDLQAGPGLEPIFVGLFLNQLFCFIP